MDKNNLLEKAKELFIAMKISDRECEAVELCTKQQRENDEWYLHRKGRITASSFHDVYVLKPQTDPKKLVSRLLRNKDLSHVPAVKWGIDHEDVAKQEYAASTKCLHQEFQCYSAGFVINPHYPHLGSSPDAFVKCACCGEGIVEIKCPFSDRKSNPNMLKNSFLNESGLIRSHRYFTQVQGQLRITRRDFCDFVVWTPVGLLVQRIYEEFNFTEKLIQKLTKFYVEQLLPAIMCNTFSGNDLDAGTFIETGTSVATESVYCYCRCEEYGKMIQCENKRCKIVWFHFTCVGLRRTPKGQWFCPDCQQ